MKPRQWKQPTSNVDKDAFLVDNKTSPDLLLKETQICSLSKESISYNEGKAIAP